MTTAPLLPPIHRSPHPGSHEPPTDRAICDRVQALPSGHSNHVATLTYARVCEAACEEA